MTSLLLLKKWGGAVLGMKPVNLMTEKFLHEIKDKSELPKAKFYPIEEWIYAYSQAKFVNLCGDVRTKEC